MTNGGARVSARRSESPARGIAAAVRISSNALQTTNTAWLATLVPTRKVRATLCFAFGRCTRNLLTTLDEGLVATGRQQVFGIKLAGN